MCQYKRNGKVKTGKAGEKGEKQWKETTGVEGLLWLKKNKGCNVLIFTV